MFNGVLQLYDQLTDKRDPSVGVKTTSHRSMIYMVAQKVRTHSALFILNHALHSIVKKLSKT